MVENLDEFTRELRTALGTAKWQLEEFEKAVRLSHRKHGDATKLDRHRQFIDAIENQIFCVEASLREYFIEEGKQPLKWVNLNEEERDDLAAFLTGTTPTIRGPKDEHLEPVPSYEESIHETCNRRREASSNQSSLDISDKVEEIQDAQFVMKKLQDNEISRSRDDVVCHTERTTNGRRVWSSPNFDTLTIVIPDEDERRNPMPTVEPTPKEKGSRTNLWRQTGREFLPAKIAGHVCSQVSGSQTIPEFKESAAWLLSSTYTCSDVNNFLIGALCTLFNLTVLFELVYDNALPPLGDFPGSLMGLSNPGLMNYKLNDYPLKSSNYRPWAEVVFCKTALQ
ncbi:uncharacterized protein E5676_scaffold152G00580 [Cucumis melo var. makuwa]|uniref:Syntaxin 6/10/61 N-terminal domain-containing protein n=1 Tax=Cucumis melo var. makuwa TaxID=1194695 RepID=A0A5D3CL05_CUCMM|nr:uncharacterized protein E5676_scaffold152G00580 [Cucumis melo var. makuwa]